jgi:hypothetical protein
MSALLNTILDRIKTEFEQVEPEWVNIEVKDTDLKFLHDECTKDSEFDPHNKRRYMYESLTSGNMYVVVAKCEYGQVFCAFETMDQMGQRRIESRLKYFS